MFYAAFVTLVVGNIAAFVQIVIVLSSSRLPLLTLHVHYSPTASSQPRCSRIRASPASSVAPAKRRRFAIDADSASRCEIALRTRPCATLRQAEAASSARWLGARNAAARAVYGGWHPLRVLAVARHPHASAEAVAGPNTNRIMPAGALPSG